MIDASRYVAERKFALRVLSFYVTLIPPDDEASARDLGGKLFYAGELDDDGCAWIVAANIAGAASLCGSSNALAPKQAIRDGIIDFLVTSLDEAVRILKNEVRKHAPAAVCIGAPPAEIEEQMSERGVAPDIVRPGGGTAGNSSPAFDDIALVSWSVSSAPARWMPKLDAFALECGGELLQGTRRWLQMSPRYLGRLAQSIHLVLADRAFATRFMENAMALEGGNIPVKLQVTYRGGGEEFNAPNWNKDDPDT
jgi:urocanate hydratase